MNKIFIAFIGLLLITNRIHAQTDTTLNPLANPANIPANDKPAKKKYNLTNRANDHFLLQLGYTTWLNVPDEIKTKGFSRSINAYFMFDFPFKTTQQLSAAIGAGIGTDHIMMDNQFVDIKGTSNTLNFDAYAGNDNVKLKKQKLMTAYLEAPVELRYVSNPEKSDKSFKFALGVKVGTLIKASTRSRITQPGTQAEYLLKESSKSYFNNIRAAGIARIGYGHFTVFSTYQFTKLLKEGAGPDLNPFTVGLSFGGL